MQRRYLVPISIVALALVLFCVCFFRASREPLFAGQPISKWLAFTNLTASDEQRLRQMSPQALPTLRSMLRARDSTMRSRFIAFLNKTRLVKIPVVRADSQHSRALLVCRVLGTNAEVLIPDVARHFHAGGAKCASAATALAHMGTSALPPLVEGLHSRSNNVQSSAIWTLGRIGPDAEAAVPALADLTSSPDTKIAVYAVGALGQIARRPEVAVPALQAALVNTNSKFRCSVIIALGRYGTNASSAIPALIAAVEDPDVVVRMRAGNALNQIRLKH